MIDERLASKPRAQRALAGLATRSLNYDPAERANAGPHNGWHIDDYCARLPSETPGEPVSGGSFEVAKGLMRDYAFADREIVRAVYDPGHELADRNMLLQARFGPLHFFAGCRVGTITVEARRIDGPCPHLGLELRHPSGAP